MLILGVLFEYNNVLIILLLYWLVKISVYVGWNVRMKYEMINVKELI